MRFSTWQAREEFATHISHNSRPIDSLLQVADDLSQAMAVRAQGRPYIGLHMRRGDCEYSPSFLSRRSLLISFCCSSFSHQSSGPFNGVPPSSRIIWKRSSIS